MWYEVLDCGCDTLDTVGNKKDLSPPFHLSQDRISNYVGIILHDISFNWQAIFRVRIDYAEVADTDDGHMKCTRNRCRSGSMNLRNTKPPV